MSRQPTRIEWSEQGQPLALYFASFVEADFPGEVPALLVQVDDAEEAQELLDLIEKHRAPKRPRKGRKSKDSHKDSEPRVQVAGADESAMPAGPQAGDGSRGAVAQPPAENRQVAPDGQRGSAEGGPPVPAAAAKCIAPECAIVAVDGLDLCAMHKDVPVSIAEEWRRGSLGKHTPAKDGARRARQIRERVEGAS